MAASDDGDEATIFGDIHGEPKLFPERLRLLLFPSDHWQKSRFCL
jgi:hypothetical protein